MTTFFVAMGLTNGVWVARIPAVKTQAHLTDARLGLALLAVPAGLLAGTVLAGKIVDRAGSSRITWLAGVALCLLVITPGFARNIWELMAALLAVGFSGGMLDVAQNAQGVLVETGYGRPIMTTLHAGFSLGAIVGALAGAAFAWAGAGAAITLAAAGLPGALATAVAGRLLMAGATEVREHGPARFPASQGSAESPRRNTVFILGILAICGLVGEGAAGDWSAVYLRDNLGTSAGVAALAYAGFSLTMTAGRFAGDRLISRFGVIRVIRACGLIAGGGLAAGLLVSWAAGHGSGAGALAAIAGFTLLGAGLSVTVPQVFAAGGRADPSRPGRGLAAVVGMGYAGLTSGPPLIGFVAAWTGLPAALGIPALLALGLAVGAKVFGRPGLTVGQNATDHGVPIDAATHVG